MFESKELLPVRRNEIVEVQVSLAVKGRLLSGPLDCVVVPARSRVLALYQKLLGGWHLEGLLLVDLRLLLLSMIKREEEAYILSRNVLVVILIFHDWKAIAFERRE